MSESRLFEDNFDAIVDADPGVLPVGMDARPWAYMLLGGAAAAAIMLVAWWFASGAHQGTPQPATARQTRSVDRAMDEFDLSKLADQSVLPTGNEVGSYFVLFVIVALAVLLLGLVIRVLKSTAFWTAVFVALLVVILLAARNGKLNDMQHGPRPDPAQSYEVAQ